MPFVLNNEKVQDVGVAAQKATELKMLGRGKAAFKKAARAAKRQAEQLEVRVQVVAYLDAEIFGPFRHVFRHHFLRALFFLLFRRIDVFTPEKEVKILEVLRVYGQTVRLYLDFGQRPPFADATFRHCLEQVVPPEKIAGYALRIAHELSPNAPSDPSKIWRGILTTEMMDLVLPLIGSTPRSVKSFRKHFEPLPEPVEVVATLTVDQRIAANLAKAVQNGKLVDLSVREDTHFVDLTL